MKIDKDKPNINFGSDKWNAACSKILIDLEHLFFNEGRATIDEVEMIIMENFKEHFPKTKTAEITNYCVRSVRGKLNGRGEVPT